MSDTTESAGPTTAASLATPPTTGPANLSEWLKIRRDPLALLEGLRSMGDLVHFMFRGDRTSYVLFHPDYVKDVLVTNHRKFGLTDIWLETKRILGNGLLHSEGDFHKRQRRLSNPAFHHGRIQEYAKTMAAYSERTSVWWQDGKQVNMHEEMVRLTFAVVGKTLFDADLEAETSSEIRGALLETANLFRLGTPIASMLRDLPVATTKRFDETKAAVDRLIYKIIEERRRSGEDRGDLLSMLLLAQDTEGDGGSMTDEQLRDETMTLVAAGHETTANALTWTWYLLSSHPDEEAELHEELERVLGGRLPTAEDIPRLPYTRKVIQESMRLYPPAWLLMRRANEQHTIGEYTIHQGANVFMFPYMIHRDPRWWPEPERFDPDRWTEDAERKRHKDAYLPFGMGPRMCIGEQFAWTEAMIVLATLAQTWKARMVPNHRVVPEPRVNLRPRGGLPMVLERRA
jgi:cytochrome P450